MLNATYVYLTEGATSESKKKFDVELHAPFPRPETVQEHRLRAVRLAGGEVVG